MGQIQVRRKDQERVRKTTSELYGRRSTATSKSKESRWRESVVITPFYGPQNAIIDPAACTDHFTVHYVLII